MLQIEKGYLMTDRRELEAHLDRINNLIDEAEDRLGAHSVKPVLMQELLRLEEMRDEILEQITLLKDQPREGKS